MRTRKVRRAVSASVVGHAALLAVLLAAGWWSALRPAPPAAPLDTRAPDVVRIDLSRTEEPAAEVALAPAQGADVPRPPEPDPTPTTPPPAKVHRPPTVTAVPRTLPPTLLAIMRRPPVGNPVTEVLVIPTPQAPQSPPAPAGAVRPAGHAATDSQAAAGPPGGDADGRPVHGALPPGASIVYVLDASGSMGEWGKLDRAKQALVGTLRRQPETVRFQVVVYAGAAELPLPAPVGGLVAATPANVGRIGPMLRIVTAAGRSNHAAGLRKALELRPDYVLILTDADDLAAAVRGLLPRGGKPVVVCAAKVSADGVADPVSLR